ncbi:uncharacterized protein LOC122428683 isoform X1 [Cervus canadensis]|uniref:uncharacterized protein LOC122428683 isoform X1 n=1 Tax=Cervus canadensis TaxID=1574408 RepID=UPI001CA3765C|nr:uncharacterized protein LOC122428683 isoform X1 [Cervus canadensis]
MNLKHSIQMLPPPQNVALSSQTRSTAIAPRLFLEFLLIPLQPLPHTQAGLQMHGWWCGSDGARVTSRLFSGPCKQSRPMTCSFMPFEEEASSVMMKKNQGVPLLTIRSSSRLQRGYLSLKWHSKRMTQKLTCSWTKPQDAAICIARLSCHSLHQRSFLSSGVDQDWHPKAATAGPADGDRPPPPLRSPGFAGLDCFPFLLLSGFPPSPPLRKPQCPKEGSRPASTVWGLLSLSPLSLHPPLNL